MTDTSSDKAAQRAAARILRRDAARAAGASAARALAGLASALALPPGAVAAGYWPLGDEIDPVPLMEALAALGHPLALPVVAAAGGMLDFRPWSPGEALEPGPHHTRHPSAGNGSVTPAVLLVPLLAFDRRGFRLGYGGGYYDRTLAGLRRGGESVLAVGLAFAAQEMERIAADPWDQILDRIATEQGVIVTDKA